MPSEIRCFQGGRVLQTGHTAVAPSTSVLGHVPVSPTNKSPVFGPQPKKREALTEAKTESVLHTSTQSHSPGRCVAPSSFDQLDRKDHETLNHGQVHAVRV